MITIIENPSPSEFTDICKRPVLKSKDLQGFIADVFKQVESSGDVAVKEFTRTFDRAELNDLRVDSAEVERAFAQMESELMYAVQRASENIRAFHTAQIRDETKLDFGNGIRLGQKAVPIKRVGIYIPGGTAPLLSTILMLAIPAQIAGCKEIVLCSPPSFNGAIHPSILAVANMCGIKEIYACGGAQAVAAMAIGTESIKKVMKIFGPGNQFVMAAKAFAMNYGCAMDLPAGPSELLVYADDQAIPSFVAADLLSQAEHGADSQVVCVASSSKMALEILEETYSQVESLPRRDIAMKALENSRFVVIENLDEAIDFINEYGAEHLILASVNAEEMLDQVQNAGSVFLGNFCPESAGDYASGTNHTLPTNGWAKSYSGVNVDAFTKKITYQSISEHGLREIGGVVTTMARAEELEAHARAIDVRLNYLNKLPFEQ